MKAKALTQTRNKTHGDFGENAHVSQHIKDFLREQDGWKDLTPVQKEAIDMICLKLSRIVSGKSGVADHWDDIGGYAALASQEIASDV